jgi:MerR family Zn(II)-responsive transcriptional regulator of zntA
VPPTSPRAAADAAPSPCERCGASSTKEGCRDRAALPVVTDVAERPHVHARSAEPAEARGPLSSGDLARACNTTVRTVRFYEEAGLVEPVTRSEGGHRLYAAHQVPRLSLIIDLREAGLSLQDIKSLFELKQHAGTSLEASERMTTILHRRIDEMQAKIACLRKLREELAQTATMIRECGSCSGDRFPTHCGHCDVMSRPDLPRAMRLLWG